MIVLRVVLTKVVALPQVRQYQYLGAPRRRVRIGYVAGTKLGGVESIIPPLALLDWIRTSVLRRGIS